jgi:hypothetical protein
MNSPDFNGQAHIRYRGEDMTIAYALHEYYQSDVTKPHARLMPNVKYPSITLFWRCFEAAKKMGWHIVDFDQKSGRIEATDTSFWFGRVSDIVIRVQPSGFMGARFDVRSESREGDIDNGANLERLKQFVITMGG